ncbi:alpha/beta hydrolase [Lentzea sp. NPDC051213]|uniref:alpha/beta hydrolase n=1 Tax=Lentzea sp. NPDC051213 TaxID=3364126 RepID=UPI0037ACA905
MPQRHGFHWTCRRDRVDEPRIRGTLAGARTMRRAFGDWAALLTVDQGGHGAYLTGKNRCANDKVTEYLLGGQRPAHDLKCTAETGRPLWCNRSHATVTPTSPPIPLWNGAA